MSRIFWEQPIAVEAISNIYFFNLLSSSEPSDCMSLFGPVKITLVQNGEHIYDRTLPAGDGVLVERDREKVILTIDSESKERGSISYAMSRNDQVIVQRLKPGVPKAET